MNRNFISRTMPAVSVEAVTSIEIGLLDGNIRTGRMGAFSPTMADLVIDLDRFGRTFLHAEQIAYVAFHRSANDRSAAAVEPDAERLRVHVAGNRSFAVFASAQAARSSLGFFATPTDPRSEFRQLYFYAHGIKAKEKDVPLGEMLVDSGMLGPDSLRRGIDAQEAHRAATLGQILVENGEVDPAEVERAAALQARRKLRIGQILVEAGLASQSSIEHALAEQKKRKGKRLGEVLVDLGIVRENDLAVTLGQKFQIPFVDLDQITIDPAAGALATSEFVEKWRILPVSLGPGSLTVAISDPLAIDAIDALRIQIKRRIDEVIAAPSQLRRYVDEYLARTAAAAQEAGPQLDELLRDLQADDVRAGAEIEEEDDSREISAMANSDGGIVRVVNQIIMDACRRGASDIHVEPNGKERNVVVRFRVDGDCIAYQEVPAAYRHQLIARIKIMAGLDISERRKPQDGKIRFRIGERIVELRVATLPTVNKNEDAVLRILASAKPVPLERLGLSAWNLRELRRIITQPYGLVLCVGPTGSGKTTTLHSAIGAINTVDMKIWTAEDPVEITQPGLRQMQVSPKIGLTFAAAMRAFLRADPDVIMVGEMRDQETATTAVEASLTGHLVLSTLHTNSAPETVTRLLDMGLEPFSFADSLLGILAQRLARALCKKCRRQAAGTEADYTELTRAFDEDRLESTFGIRRNAEFSVWRATGCENCGGTGYKGRIALHELLVADKEMHHAIARRAPVREIRLLAIERGMSTLLQDGVAKAIAGETDMKQVLAVCSK